jgi:CubicO group peptidase (beta-lactamase class C family)
VQADFRRAAQYSHQHQGLTMVVAHQGQIVFESYRSPCRSKQAHVLASGTKSFSAAIAVAAIQDGLLTWDERIAETLYEWQSHPQSALITIRQLLNLTSGIPGGKIGRIPTYAQAITTLPTAPPGSQFQYGPIPFQVFGEVMRRKLAANGEPADPLDYLTRKVLQPIGLRVHSWRRGKDGYPRLPSGAKLAAREWLKYGQLLLNQGQWDDRQILDRAFLGDCFRGSCVNPGYGLTFWLSAGYVEADKPSRRSTTVVPEDIIMALGAGKQGLYVIPSHQLVVVRQGILNRATMRERVGFQHPEFLKLILEL